MRAPKNQTYDSLNFDTAVAAMDVKELIARFSISRTSAESLRTYTTARRGLRGETLTSGSIFAQKGIDFSTDLNMSTRDAARVTEHFAQLARLEPKPPIIDMDEATLAVQLNIAPSAAVSLRAWLNCNLRRPRPLRSTTGATSLRVVLQFDVERCDAEEQMAFLRDCLVARGCAVSGGSSAAGATAAPAAAPAIAHSSDGDESSRVPIVVGVRPESIVAVHLDGLLGDRAAWNGSYGFNDSYSPTNGGRVYTMVSAIAENLATEMDAHIYRTATGRWRLGNSHALVSGSAGGFAFSTTLTSPTPLGLAWEIEEEGAWRSAPTIQLSSMSREAFEEVERRRMGALRGVGWMADVEKQDALVAASVAVVSAAETEAAGAGEDAVIE